MYTVHSRNHVFYTQSTVQTMHFYTWSTAQNIYFMQEYCIKQIFFLTKCSTKLLFCIIVLCIYVGNIEIRVKISLGVGSTNYFTHEQC